MTTLEKTYRFAAILTLLLFAGNLLLPAGTAAMSLHCEMDRSAHSMHECCDGLEVNHKKASADDCEVMSFCEQEVQSDQSEIPAVVQSNGSAAVDLSTEIDILPDEPTSTNVLKDETSDSKNTPPLFLLNSVFLN